MKSESTRRQDFIQTIQRYGGDWIEGPQGIPVITGKRDGVTVDAGNGNIWVRFGNGKEEQVYNGLAPVAFDWHVTIGHLRSDPKTWRVREIRHTYPQPPPNSVKNHHEQHEWNDNKPAFDIVWVNRKQIISATAFVADAANFKIQVIGGLFPIPGGWAMADSTDGTDAHPHIDVSSYIPGTGSNPPGAKYLSIETETSGTLVVNDTGTLRESMELLTFDDVPNVPAGNRLIVFVLLYENQERLLNKHIYPPGLFMTDYAAVETGYQIDNAPADTPVDADKWGFWDVADEALKSITHADLLELISLVVTPTTRWIPLANGDPADPSLIFDAFGNVIMVIEDI